MNQSTPAVKAEVRNLSFFYGDFQAVKDVSMPVAEHEVTALIGPSGCGKSTFLRCFNRMHDLYPGSRYQGEINLRPDGVNLLDRGIDPVETRLRIGMVFQKPNPFPKSIFENVAYGLRVIGEKRRQVLADKVEKALRDAALWEEVKDRLHTLGTSLSGGQQQRLCIARAIATRPEVILMDEPCSALDPIATAQIDDLIHQMAQDFCVIIVTHSMSQARRVSDRTAYFHMGNMVEYGETEQIFINPREKLTETYVSGRIG